MTSNEKDSPHAFTDIKNKLQCHIQMTAGKQKDIANRMQAFENHVKQQSAKLMANKDDQDDASPSCTEHQPKQWSNDMPEHINTTHSRSQILRGCSDTVKEEANKRRISQSASSWEGQPNDMQKNGKINETEHPKNESQTNTWQCPICKDFFLYYEEAMAHRCLSKQRTCC